MRNLRLGTKIGLGFALLIIIAAFLGGLSIWIMNGVRDKAVRLSDECLPQTGLANNMERSSLKAMYAMRGFVLSEDRSYLDQATANLEKVGGFLRNIQELTGHFTDLIDLRQRAVTASAKIGEYRELMDEAVIRSSAKSDSIKVLGQAGKEYMDMCHAFLDSQNQNLHRQITEGATEEQLLDRQKKINMVIELIALGLETRFNVALALALRAPDKIALNKAKFERIMSILDESQPITRQQENLDLIKDLRRVAQVYHQETDRLFESWTGLEKLNESLGLAGEAVLGEAQLTAETGIAQGQEIAAQTRQALSGATKNMIIGLFLALIIGSGLAVFITRSIIGPVIRAVELAEAVRQGDLSVRLNLKRRDEVGRLTRAMDEMADGLEAKAYLAGQISVGDLSTEVELASDKDTLGQALSTMTATLNRVMGDVIESSIQVAAGSNQVADSSQSLSDGATKQAASLEEITSSLTQLAKQTRVNAENAAHVSQLALTARNNAELGNGRMSDMIGAMNEINESSREIAHIIKAIDEIAFQTNLLALNAAVEAARAGKHGQGFAVVAQEVRMLAGRSAKAAQETTELIDSAIKKVERGTDIANKTAQALSEIVTGSTRVTDLVTEIASASNEQAQGIIQINQGLTQIEEVTHLNTANAEQTASAAEQLSSQALQLKDMVAGFKLSSTEVKKAFRPVNYLAMPKCSQAPANNKPECET